jgi:dTDP-4-amino-4,6-dideoxygalactose transaminase
MKEKNMEKLPNLIRLSKSIVGNREANAVSKVIKDIGYLGMGKVVQKFESEIEKYLGAKPNSCCCVNTGTSALHLAIQSVTKPGDLVLVPSFTYVATFQAISAAGCVPVSCDIDSDTFLLDLNDVEIRMNRKCRALVYVHYASNPGDLDALYAFGKKHKLRIIEDAAHSFGCSFKGKKIGSFGDITCFSFDGIKNITSGEGGAILTEDENVLSFSRDARLLGVIKDTDKRYSGERSWEFDVNHQGYRFHMSNIFAAIGLIQLKRLEEEFATKRRVLKETYKACLSDNAHITFQKTNNDSKIIPHIMPVRIASKFRDDLFNLLISKGIQVGIHYKPNHLLTFFITDYPIVNTEQLYAELISLPLHPDLSINEVQSICYIINSFTSKK